MKQFLFSFCFFISIYGSAQELYVFSEPASNMPSHALSPKQYVKVLSNSRTNKLESRYTSEMMIGINKNLMIHAAATLSDMYTEGHRWESVRLYSKYRMYTKDGMFSHFRLASFAELAHSNNKPKYEELSLDGDQSGVQFGFIATQLLHKLAISSTISVIESLQESRRDPNYYPVYPYQAINYSLSAGYLVAPKTYTSYDQTNFNIYLEVLAQNSLDRKLHFIDLAPALQLIFNSSSKLNLGYRFQVAGNMNRMSNSSFLLSYEWVFLNAFK
ncbi:MAG: hypothetical protein WCJ80_11565 [Bacteroidota bacterium]